MKAIQVKYLPWTETRPARYKAWTEGGNSITVSASGIPDGRDPWLFAATALCQKMNWSDNIVGGGLPNGDYAFCFVR
jgi:hypothetical protein